MTNPDGKHTPILIAGAGPTGLVLAVSLVRRGVPFRLIDQADGPGERSRAMVVHARTLEFYRQFGFADEVIEQGIKVDRAHMRVGSAAGRAHEVVAAGFSDLGGGLSPYPFPLCYPQDDHERFLLDKLKAAGVEAEWRTKLVGCEQDAAGVRATIARDGGRTEEVRADYLCGCDGAHSVVRQKLELGFPGGTYRQLYYVADVTIAGEFKRDLYMNLGRETFALMLPVRSRGVQRLIGLVPPELSDKKDLTFENIRADCGTTGRCHRQRGELVRHVSRAPPGGRAFPSGARLHPRRCRTRPQPRRRPGHEHWHRRRNQSRLEVGARGERPCRRFAARHL